MHTQNSILELGREAPSSCPKFAVSLQNNFLMSQIFNELAKENIYMIKPPYNKAGQKMSKFGAELSIN